MTAKRKVAAMAPEVEEAVDPNDELYFTCLGGGNEVGRSCHILRYKGKTVMVSTVNRLLYMYSCGSLCFISSMLVCIPRTTVFQPFPSMMISISALSMSF
jgi:hypothetical protein